MNSVQETEFLETIIENGIATIEFGYKKVNAMPLTLLLKLEKELQKTSDNQEVRLVVLQSRGNGTFCAGASFDELLQIKSIEDSVRFFNGFARVINAIRKHKNLIIGKVQGKSVGGGVGIISACDYVLASNEAQVRLSELSIGIGPYVIAPAIERKIGISGFTELTLNPNSWKNAQWAKEKGLFSEIFSAEHLNKEVKKISKKLANSNKNSLTELKKLFWKNTENWDNLLFENATISAKLLLSEKTQSLLNSLKK